MLRYWTKCIISRVKILTGLYPPFNPFSYTPLQPLLIYPPSTLSSSTPFFQPYPPFQPSLPSHFNCPFIFHPAVSYLRFLSLHRMHWVSLNHGLNTLNPYLRFKKSVLQWKNIGAENLKVYCWTNITSFIFVVYCHICLA